MVIAAQPLALMFDFARPGAEAATRQAFSWWPSK
jgi:hypothetical protein